MRLLLQLLVAASIVLSVWFVLSIGNPRNSDSPTMAWLLVAWGASTTAIEAMIFVALLNIDIPMWVAALILAAQDAVYAWRIALVHAARRASANTPTAPD